MKRSTRSSAPSRSVNKRQKTDPDRFEDAP